DFVLDIGFSISLLILGIFLLVVCYICYVLIKNQSILSFLNEVLNEKLEDINKFLEERVKERTAELEKSLKLVTYQATHDLLTDLPNQRLLAEDIHSSIVRAKENNRQFALVCFSLNELDKINDGLGHQVGDFVIKAIAKRLEHAHEKFKSKLDKYVVALSRRDVFVILMEPIELNNIEEEVKQLLNVVEEPIYTENQVVKLTASIGLSIYPHNGNDIKTLLMNADAAMLRARQYGGNRIDMYRAEINANISKQLELENHLYQALKNNEFMLRYQPFVDLKTGEICGAEALVRWNSPAFGIVSPDSFIPLAEANGLIIPLGEWVLKTACEEARHWNELGFARLKIAVNLSAKQLHQKDIVQIIATTLKSIKLNPNYLELELTETAAFQAELLPIVKQIKTLGVGLSIDDFGTGYSGLSNLKQFDIDKLKIDKSFVRDIDTNSDSRAIVANTILLAKKLNINVLAEGVETSEQLHILLDLGCDMVQGYYFSQPVSAEIFRELLIHRRRFEI
ncbi:MAG: putative bifunctional diguanylate cyclase/phosphodiesterase, partial [Gammaproteobacteria bacterium]